MLWHDNHANNQFNIGDALSIKYALNADTFAELDSVAKMNAVVHDIPESSSSTLLISLVGGGMAIGM